jgi:uncharacterized protein (DUF952 family)
MDERAESIYHLTPASYYHHQPQDQPYQTETLAQEGFIHCTRGLDMLVEIANTYFGDLREELVVLEIDPARLTSPLKFEPPIPYGATGQPDITISSAGEPGSLFPHIYGPLNRQAIMRWFSMSRSPTGQWQLPA